MRDSLKPLVAAMIVKSTRPSGSIDGHQCLISFFSRFGVASVAGVPPSADTLSRPPSHVRAKMMRPRPSHTAPGPPRTSQIRSTSPPAVEILKIFASR
jgi:hypothetical protein